MSHRSGGQGCAPCRSGRRPRTHACHPARERSPFPSAPEPLRIIRPAVGLRDLRAALTGSDPGGIGLSLFREGRALFDAVQQRLTEQWTTRSAIRNVSAHLLTGLLFDDCGHRMVPTHATKASVRYRYYVSLPHLYGESKTASVGSVSRVPATDIEDTVVNSLSSRLIVQKNTSDYSITRIDDRKVILEQVARIDVYEDLPPP
jgi:hypothetical protein